MEKNKLKPTFLDEAIEDETENSRISISNLPLFYTTQKTRDVIQEAMEKSENLIAEKLK